jgi:hypothetical protein
MKTKKNIFFILSGLKEIIMDYNLQEGENGLKHISLPNIINQGAHKLIGTSILNKKKNQYR